MQSPPLPLFFFAHRKYTVLLLITCVVLELVSASLTLASGGILEGVEISAPWQYCFCGKLPTLEQIFIFYDYDRVQNPLLATL
jgi:hypothetical protein